jgi:hypothetical protein
MSLGSITTGSLEVNFTLPMARAISDSLGKRKSSHASVNSSVRCYTHSLPVFLEDMASPLGDMGLEGKGWRIGHELAR